MNDNHDSVIAKPPGKLDRMFEKLDQMGSPGELIHLLIITLFVHVVLIFVSLPLTLLVGALNWWLAFCEPWQAFLIGYLPFSWFIFALAFLGDASHLSGGSRILHNALLGLLYLYGAAILAFSAWSIWW